MKEITSLQNATIKETKKLLKPKYREQTGDYLIEGEHLIQEALKEALNFEKIFVTEKFIANHETFELLKASTDVFLVSEQVMKSLSSLPTPQGIAGVLQQQEKPLQFPLEGPLLILDRVQDPGNVGTMIRTADAAGYAGVVLGEGCADIYSGKVQRSLQGSHFHLPVVQKKLETFLPFLKENGIQLLGTALDEEAKIYTEFTPEKNFALIMGNEGQGVAQQFLQLTDRNLYIPIHGQAESLNVAVAAGILMYGLKGKILQKY
ncbi:TrmH family RNA methyltransferase [Vagococcus elongatus]|uniref:23S rRNA methyltransferase n=1 Tax=Vagococcus elongatus TaxID=180344 RepID=A0A430AX80_9ENTE|nr:RNA methyltransferase [Vagococcus elongatus]RSU12670.1 23S rRNA methyltransferase [Vagococcus elongatus]